MMVKGAVCCKADSGIVTVRLEIDAMRYEISRALLKREGEIQALAEQGIDDVIKQLRPKIAAMALEVAVAELREYITNAVRDIFCSSLGDHRDESLIPHIQSVAKDILRKGLAAMAEEEK